MILSNAAGRARSRRTWPMLGAPIPPGVHRTASPGLQAAPARPLSTCSTRWVATRKMCCTCPPACANDLMSADRHRHQVHKVFVNRGHGPGNPAYNYVEIARHRRPAGRGRSLTPATQQLTCHEARLVLDRLGAGFRAAGRGRPARLQAPMWRSSAAASPACPRRWPWPAVVRRWWCWRPATALPSRGLGPQWRPCQQRPGGGLCRCRCQGGCGQGPRLVPRLRCGGGHRGARLVQATRPSTATSRAQRQAQAGHQAGYHLDALATQLPSGWWPTVWTPTWRCWMRCKCARRGGQRALRRRPAVQAQRADAHGPLCPRPGRGGQRRGATASTLNTCVQPAAAPARAGATNTGCTRRGTCTAAAGAAGHGAARHGGYGSFGWLRRRIVPIGSFIVVTEPLGCGAGPGLAGAAPHLRDHCQHPPLLPPDAPDHRLVFGGRARFAISSPTSDARSGEILRAGMAEMFPATAGRAASTIAGVAWST